MSPRQFYAANILSALAWAPAHIFPGVLVADGASTDHPKRRAAHNSRIRRIDCCDLHYLCHALGLQGQVILHEQFGLVSDALNLANDSLKADVRFTPESGHCRCVRHADIRRSCSAYRSRCRHSLHMRNQKFVFAHATAENVTVPLVGDFFER